MFLLLGAPLLGAPRSLVLGAPFVGGGCVLINMKRKGMRHEQCEERRTCCDQPIIRNGC
jgi:hypothetical protein